MAVRHATRKYASIEEFVQDHETTLSQGALALPSQTVEGDLAPEIKLDLVLPVVGRLGPIPAQVLQRTPDGGAALRLPEIPPKVQRGMDRLFSIIDEVEAYLLATGRVVSAEEAAARKAPAAGRADGDRAPSPHSPPRAPTAPPEGDPSVPEQDRGFAIPDLSDQEPILDGVMGGRDLRDALIELAVERRTGLLVVVSGDGEKKRFGFWDRGGPVGWRSEPLEESEVLGVLLYRAGRLTQEQLAESLEIMDRDGVRQGEALIEMGLLSFPQVVMALQKQTEFILQKVLRTTEGAWAFFELDRLPERFIIPPLRIPSLLFRAMKEHTRELASGEVVDSHRPNIDRYVFVRDGVDEVLEEIKFTTAEKKFLEILRSNSWRLRELFSVSNLSRSETGSTLWALNELGFMEYREEETRERYLERVRTRIEGKLRQVDAGSRFEVLEIHWICLGPEIETAYRKLRKEFDPRAYRDLPADLQDALKTINAEVEKAYRFLRKEQQRREYREELIEGMKIRMSADILAKKGEMAIMKADRPEALACWGKAVELVPGDPRFREGLQRAQHLQS